jgi:elongation factor P
MMLANDLRKGMAVREKGDVCLILQTELRTQGRGSGWVQLQMRNLRTGSRVNAKYASSDKLETVNLSRQDVEFSYADQEGYHFMDPSTYETTTLSREMVGDDAEYLIENLEVVLLLCDDVPLALEIPDIVELVVTEAPDAIRGDTVNNPQKVVKLETGKEINAPMFIKTGEKIRVNTANGTYAGRA